MWPFPRQHPDEIVRRYQANTPRRLPRNTPLAGLRLLSVDLETTGFRVGTDLVLSIAAVDFTADEIKVSGISNWMVRHAHTPVNEATAIHGILPSESGKGEPEAGVLSQLLPLLEGSVLVGHHVSFDAAMLDDALRRTFGIRLRNPLVDTARLAMSTIDAFHQTGYSNQRPPTLDEVCAKAGVALIDRHTAVGDAFTTAQLFLFLCAKLKHMLGRELIVDDIPYQSS